jgi:hypothetical protein
MAHPRAGQPALPEDLIDVDAVISAYYDLVPDPSNPDQQVAFGTSGHRGSSLDTAFNDAHIAATTQAIVEYRDATAAQRAVREVNSSIYVFRADRLWPVLDRLRPHNAQGELYLTDSVALLVEDGNRVAVHKGDDPVETEGVNTRVELAAAAAALRDRVNEEHMLAGVTIVDPASTWIDADAAIEADAVIHPFTVIRGATRIAARAEIGPQVDESPVDDSGEPSGFDLAIVGASALSALRHQRLKQSPFVVAQIKSHDPPPATVNHVRL